MIIFKYNRGIRSSPNYLQRLLVLARSLNTRRISIALHIVRQNGWRVFINQLKMHTSFRWRLQRNFGAHFDAAFADESVALSATELYQEEAWPDEHPLVSVVIPCVNYGAFLATAVDSALDQTFHDLEVIVVDGGSTDGTTRPIVSALKRPRTRVFLRDGRHRVGDNRNFGIQQARGKHVCCLDADDKLAPTYIEKAVFLIESHGYDVVSTSVRRFGASDEPYDVFLPRPDLSDLLAGNHVTTCAVFRRVLWERAGGYADAPEGSPYLYEDWRFWIRLAAHGARFANIVGEELFFYRIHGGSLSTAPGVLPKDVQARMIQAAERDLLTPAAIARSRSNAARRLQAAQGYGNLLRHAREDSAAPTILVALPYLIVGGGERLLSQVVRHLRSNGCRIIIVTSVPTTPDQGDTTEWFAPSTDEIYHLPRFLHSTYWFDFMNFLIEAKRVDILWIVGSAFAYRSLEDLKRRHPRLRVLDLLFNTVGHFADNRTHSRFIDCTLAENGEVAAALSREGEQSSRIRLIRNGVDLDHYTPGVRAPGILASRGIGPERFVAGFSGRFSEEKDPRAVLRIAEHFADEAPVRFVMIGSGPLAGELRRGIKRKRLGQRVHLVGTVSDVRDYLACCDALVLPSKVDGRPNAVMEALAMGVPVIASRVGGLPELVRHGETGFLCEPGDAAAFAGCIREMLQDADRHARMRKAARRFAEAHLSIEPMLAGYTAAIGDLLGTPQYADCTTENGRNEQRR